MIPKDPILLCEDSEYMLNITRLSLELEGFSVDTAQNTDEIYAKLRSRKPFLILLDYNIPNDGAEKVIRRLKDKEDTRDIPVLLYSGEAQIDQIAQRIGANGFLRKPFETRELLREINNIQQRWNITNSK